MKQLAGKYAIKMCTFYLKTRVSFILALRFIRIGSFLP